MFREFEFSSFYRAWGQVKEGGTRRWVRASENGTDASILDAVLRCFAFDRVISARTWMLPMLMREPELLPKFFNYYVRPPSPSSSLALLSRSTSAFALRFCEHSKADLSFPSPFPSSLTNHISPRTSIFPSTPFVPQIYEHGTNKLLDRHDLLHPNADGHKSMADTIIMYLAQQVSFEHNIF